MPECPNVLVLSGHDPSGGAGFQADIEAVGAQGAHTAGALTALTRQDTRNAYAVMPTDAAELASMVDTLLADMAFHAIKIGLMGSPEQAAAIAERAGGRLLVLDPVLRAGGGATLAADPVARALAAHLFDHTTLLTPNAAEARLLCAGEQDLDTCGMRLSEQVEWVLVTGGDEPGDAVVNSLFRGGEVVERFVWPRLPGTFHGAGCTLSAAVSARLAHGDTLPDAVAAAQRYTQACLADAFSPGRGQRVPDRFGHDRQ